MEHKKLIELYPDHLAKYREFKAITATEQVELDLILSQVRQALENQFVESCNEEAIEKYEQIYSVDPIAGATLDERKFNVMARLTESTPYTERSLADMLTSLCGADGFSLGVDVENFMVTVKVALTKKNNLISVKNLLKKTVPCNIIWDADLMYNQYLRYGNYTYGELGAYTCGELRNEVIQ